MTYALVVVIKKMIMVLLLIRVVTKHIAVVWDLGQLYLRNSLFVSNVRR